MDMTPMTPAAIRMRPPTLQTDLEAPPTPVTVTKMHDRPSPPQTPSTSPVKLSPVPLQFDVSKGHLLGSGLWSRVFKVSADTDSASSAMYTPPATPQKTRAPGLPQLYAVKVASRPDAVPVFAREAETLSLLQQHDDASRYIVPFYGTANNDTALVFHASTAGDLDHFASCLDFDQVEQLCLRVSQQLTSALAFLHASRVIHADIKPANVLVDGTPDAFVFRFCDFSAAIIYEPTLQTSDSAPDLKSLPSTPVPSRANSARLTAGGGTWMYMAPEQLSSDPVSSAPSWASDVYSLGITLLTFLLRQNPYIGVEKNYNVFMLREAIKQGTPMRFARDDLDLESVVSKLEASPIAAPVLRLVESALWKPKEKRMASDEWASRFEALT